MYINEINQKARQLSNVINPNVIDTFDINQEGAPTYDGTFKTIYDMVKAGQIKLLTQYGQVVGISVNPGTNDLAMDNLAARSFSRAYTESRAMRYVQVALTLATAGVEVSEIDESDGIKIYLLTDGKVLNDNLTVISELTEEQKEIATVDNVKELLDSNMQSVIQESRHTCPTTTVSADRGRIGRPVIHTPVSELPSEVTLTAEELAGIPRDVHSRQDYLKRHLKRTYDHFLAAGYDPSVQYHTDGSVTISNIKWGRSTTPSERQR